MSGDSWAVKGTRQGSGAFDEHIRTADRLLITSFLLLVALETVTGGHHVGAQRTPTTALEVARGVLAGPALDLQMDTLNVRLEGVEPVRRVVTPVRTLVTTSTKVDLLDVDLEGALGGGGVGTAFHEAPPLVPSTMHRLHVLKAVRQALERRVTVLEQTGPWTRSLLMHVLHVGLQVALGLER